MKRWIITCIIVLLAVSAVLFFKREKSVIAEKNEYITAEVTRGEVVNTITSSGTLKPVSTVDVGTQVSGIINKVYVDFNDSVTRGQVIAELDRTFLAGALDEALAARARAKALFDQAEAELKRNEPLFKKGFISDQEFTNLKTNFETQQAALQSADASVKKARINLQYATITSPITGTVIERNIEAGQTVASSFSAPTLFVIAENLRRMQILASVDEADIGGIKNGQEVRFSVQAYPDRVFTGAVEQVRLQPTITQNVVTYTVVIGTDNVDGVLLPGMTATVDFVIEKAVDALIVPSAALRFTPEGVDSVPRPQRMNRERKQADGITTGWSKGENAQWAGKTGSGRPKDAASRGVIWQLAADNTLKPVFVHTGLTDGKNTVITSRNPIDEGMVIVTGVKAVEKKKKKSVSLLPQPGRMRRGH